MRTILLHDTLSGKLAPLRAPDPERALGIYACGPTVYSRIHIGNARPFVIFSLFARFLRSEGYRTRLVVNVTDINDKIYVAAGGAGEPSGEFSARMTRAYFEDTDRLELGRPDAEPLATAMIAGIAAGQRVFGENRVQEAKSKWPPLTAKYAGLALHLIGPLQSNKAKEAVALFDAIHSVDRASLCEALAKEIAKQGRQPLLFAEINAGAESQKAGVLPQDVDAFLQACRERYGLTMSGLMCIPPLDEAPGPHFALTAKIAQRNGLKLLSMGMSADFPVAISLGATHVRIGSAIFGGRH